MGCHRRNHLGSATNATGASTATQRYYPWGAQRGTGQVTTPCRFTGQREESTIGLYFYNARWYDAALARFAQADTIVPEPGNPQALNRYAYTLNNPVKYTDPSGHVYDPFVGAGMPRSPFPTFGPYDRGESIRQALTLAVNWITETGATVKEFLPDNSLTQDVMHDPQMAKFREVWKAAGYELPFNSASTIDVRSQKITITGLQKGAKTYADEHVQLLHGVLGLGSDAPEGQDDAVGAVLGSLDKISVKEAPYGMVKFTVHNVMNWASLTRIPSTNISLLPIDFPRELGAPFVAGGHSEQYFYWWERNPNLGGE